MFQGKFDSYKTGRSPNGLKTSIFRDYSGFSWDIIGWNITDLIKRKENVCYPPLGCFDLKGPWKSTMLDDGFTRLLPEPPEDIRTTFTLFTRQNPTEGQEISTYTDTTISGSYFSLTRPTIFVIHGFLQKGDVYWIVVSIHPSTVVLVPNPTSA